MTIAKDSLVLLHICKYILEEKVRPCVFGISDLTNGLATALHNAAGRNLRSEFLMLLLLQNFEIEQLKVCCVWGIGFHPKSNGFILE